jgi:hypothetical protein
MLSSIAMAILLAAGTSARSESEPRVGESK